MAKPYEDENPKPNELGDGSSTNSDSSEDLVRKERQLDSGSANTGSNEEADKLGQGYNADKHQPGRFRRLGNSIRKRPRRMLATAAVVVTIAAGVGGFGIIQGPLKPIHFAQSIAEEHLRDQQDASDTRMGQLLRFFRGGKSLGDTRLNYFEQRYKDKIFAEFDKVGLKPVFGRLDIYEGFDIDTRSGKSPYQGMSEQKVRSELEKKGYRIDALHSAPNGVIRVYIDDGGIIRGTLNQRKSMKLLVRELGYSRVTAAVRARPVEKFGWVTTWSPWERADKKINQSFAERYNAWKEKKNKNLKGKVDGINVNGAGAREQTGTDADGNPVTQAAEGGTDGVPSSEDAKSTFEKIQSSKTLRVTGGVGAAAGLVCAVHEVRNNIEPIKFVQVFEPLMRFAGFFLTSGNQGMYGMDLEQLGFLAGELEGTDPETGKKTSFDQAKPYKSSHEEPGGQDASGADRAIVAAGIPSYIDWAKGPSVEGMCSTAGQIAVGGLSIAVTVISGGAASAVGSIAASAVAGPIIIDRVSSLVAGEGLDTENAQGVRAGILGHWGGRALGTGISQQFGGVKLTPEEETEKKTGLNQIRNEELKEKGLAYRLFNPVDSRTLAAKVIDKTPSSASSFASAITNSPSIFASLLSSPMKLFSGIASAAEIKDIEYDYPFPMYGFSQKDLDDPLIQDPYDNAKKAEAILNDNSEYIDRAKKCFGVDINKGPHGWDAQTGDEAPKETYDNAAYEKNKCGDKGDEWTRIRFFIMDTGVMTAYACLNDDEEACSELGFGSAASSEPGGSPSGEVGEKIDSSQLGKSSDGLKCAEGTKDLGVVESLYSGELKKESGPIKMRLCQIRDIPGVGDNAKGENISGGAVVDARVSGGWAALAKKAKSDGINLTSSSSFRLAHSCGGTGDGTACARPGQSAHQTGWAIDLGNMPVKGSSTTDCSARARANTAEWKWMYNNAEQFGIKQYTYEAWHWDPMPMANRCGKQ